MRYIVGPSGVQFAFGAITDRERAGFRFFYTSNLSLKRAFLRIEQPVFDPDFWYPAWEDIDLGYRLEQRGMRLRYRAALVAYHDHPTDARRYARRQFHAGQMARVFARKHPESGLAQYTLAIHQQARPQAAALAEGVMDTQLLKAADELEELLETAGQDAGVLKTLAQTYALLLERAYVRGILAGEAHEAVSPTSRDVAAATFEALLAAEDLPAELEARAGELDDELLTLVRANALAADADGEAELAGGLRALADYITGVIEARRVPLVAACALPRPRRRGARDGAPSGVA
jgi:hypothetical protein